jgi:hypothetical protein
MLLGMRVHDFKRNEHATLLFLRGGLPQAGLQYGKGHAVFCSYAS